MGMARMCSHCVGLKLKPWLPGQTETGQGRLGWPWGVAQQRSLYLARPGATHRTSRRNKIEVHRQLAVVYVN